MQKGRKKLHETHKKAFKKCGIEDSHSRVYCHFINPGRIQKQQPCKNDPAVYHGGSMASHVFSC